MIRNIAFVAGAILATLLAQGIWSALVALNLAATPAVPWSVVFAGGLLFFGWRFATGATGPESSRAARRRYARAGALQRSRLAVALVAGALALGALIALWLVLTTVWPIPARQLDLSAYPALTVAAVLVMASIVGAVTEELGLRGYVLLKLEELMPAPFAIVVAAFLIAPGHALTQGFLPVVFLWYLVADATFGALAYLSGSIVPVIAVHAVGLLLFFSIVWPADAARATAATAWPAAGACAVLTLLATLAFARLGAAAKEEPHRLAGGVVR